MPIPFDPVLPVLVNAVAGWAAQRFGHAMVGAVLGDEQERVFREIVSDAIERTAESVSGDPEFLKNVLIDRRERLEAVRHEPDLAAAVFAVVESLNVAPPGLAEALTKEINKGVMDDARDGGPLFPLVVDAHFADLFALTSELRELLAGIVVRIREIQDTLRDHSAPITVKVFTGGWRPLRTAYLDATGHRTMRFPMPGRDLPRGESPWPFVGRRWLVQEINAFVDAHDCGYFIIEAAAGTGKTAFALWYSGRGERPIHFTEYSPDARSTAPAVRNLGAQLIVKWGLHDFTSDGHLPDKEDWYSWLYQVLEAAADRRAGRPIIVVVDGLDEAIDTSPDRLPFGLPDELPRGVYVVATVRPGGLPHQPKQPTVMCHWDRRQEQQQADMRVCLTEWARLHLLDAIEDDGLTLTEFVSELLDRSGDVWLYLQCLRDEFLQGSLRPHDVQRLPRGLVPYYHNATERFHVEDHETAWRLPLLATLAVAAEPLDASTLITLAGLEDSPEVRRFLNGPLRPFCEVSEVSEGSTTKRFALRHPSFREYLTAGPGANDPANVRDRRASFADACRAAHQRVCDRYLALWGGLDEQLPALAADPALAQCDNGYALRALSTHLVAAGRDCHLHRLLACGPLDQNIWYAAHESAGEAMGFLDDVAAARRSLDRLSNTRKLDTLGLRVRYSLMEAAIATAVTNISPDLIAELVKRGMWEVARAFHAIERIIDVGQRAEALLRIIDMLPEGLVPDAWTVALASQKSRDRFRTIIALIPRLPDDLIDSAIQTINERWVEPGALAAALSVVSRLPEERLGNFPWSGLDAMQYGQQMVIHWMVGLRRGDPQAADDALAWLANEVDNEFDRCECLAALIPRLPAITFDAVMAVLADCPARYRSDAFIALARHAPTDRLTDVLALATDVEWQTTPPEAEQQPWLHLMRELGPRLVGREQEAAAVALALTLSPERRGEALEALAPHLTIESARQALEALEHVLEEGEEWLFGDIRPLMVILGTLAQRLPAPEGRAAVAAAMTRYIGIGIDVELTSEPETMLAEQLAPVAGYLHRNTVRETLRCLCRVISLADDFAVKYRLSLERIAPRVRDDPEMVREALDMVLSPGAWRLRSRLVALSVLAPHLENEALGQAMKRVLPGPIEMECFTAVAALGRVLPTEGERVKIARRALDLAFNIGNDMQCCKAVAALAPALPQDLSVEALEFVGTMTHRRGMSPSIRDALEALAPQLPKNTKNAFQRALEILLDTSSIGPEDIPRMPRLAKRLGQDDPTGAIREVFQDAYPKGSWLRAIAPFLSAPLAEEALVVARRLPDYARRASLAALIPRLPDRLRPGVAHEVLELLDVAPRETDTRLAVLARLAEATNTNEVTIACQQTIGNLRVGHFSWGPFIDLLAHLPDDVIETALAFSARMKYLDHRCETLVPLAPRIPEQVVHTLVGDLEPWKGESGAERGERARALVALTVRISDEQERHRILSLVLNEMVEQPWWYIYQPAFIALIPLLPPQLRLQGVASALQQCLDAHETGDPDALIDILEGPELEMALTELGKVKDPSRRARGTATVLRRAGVLAEYSTVLPDIDVLAAWPPATTRSELLSLVGASAWWIHQHGGTPAVDATVDAVFDMSRWWR